MFYRDFKEEVAYYDHNDHDGFKLLGTFVIAVVVTLFNAKSVSFFFSSETTPYDGSIILMVLIGALSMVLSYFSLSYLTNVVLGTYNYVTSFQLPTKKETRISFKMEKLFDITLKNPILYLVSLSLGHFLGAYERYTYIKTLTDVAPWKTAPNYFLTYVKYPVMTLLYGIVMIALVYAIVVLLQKPLIHLLTNAKSARVLHNASDFMRTVFYYALSKSLLMVFIGLLPAISFVLYTIGLSPTDLTLKDWVMFYVKFCVVAYPITTGLLMLLDSVHARKDTMKQEENAVIDGETVKTNQTSYDYVAPILISEYVDEDVRKAIDEINAIVAETNPYLQLTDIEETHVLKRITEQEIINLIAHYNKLSSDTKTELKEVLLARLQSAKETAKEISAIAQEYHYNAFQKQADLMDTRYKETKKNA